MIGLNYVRSISLAEIRTQKNTRRFFRPKKYTVKSSTQKNTGVENFRPKKIRRSPPSRLYPSNQPGGSPLRFAFG